MEPRTITLPVTFRVGSLKALGPASGPQQEWATREVPERPGRPGRRYGLTIGAGGNTQMAARARHGDRRLSAHADLAPFLEGLFDRLAAMLEVPVFACCDRPQPTWPGCAGAAAPASTSTRSGRWSSASTPPWPTSPPASGRRAPTVGWPGARP
jgi:hypothetical protein